MLKRNVSLKSYSSIAVGGSAKFLIEVCSIEEMIEALEFSNKQKIKFIVIGKGSNFVFCEGLFNGLVIVNKITYFEQRNHTVYVGAGYSFSSLGARISQKGLSGLEFAAAIPGSVGGAVYMNAGASGQETRDCLKSVSYLDENLKLINREVLNTDFSYRHSIFQKMKVVIVGAEFELTLDVKAKIRQKEILKGRVLSQPYDKKSAGCIFKNPKGYRAGALIEECGLKGYRIGGAKISKKHANFLINIDDASMDDVKALTLHVKNEVYRQKGVMLEREVRFFDEF